MRRGWSRGERIVRIAVEVVRRALQVARGARALAVQGRADLYITLEEDCKSGSEVVLKEGRDG